MFAFKPIKVKFCFQRGLLRWLRATKNANVSWLLNLQNLCIFEKCSKQKNLATLSTWHSFCCPREKIHFFLGVKHVWTVSLKINGNWCCGNECFTQLRAQKLMSVNKIIVCIPITRHFFKLYYIQVFWKNSLNLLFITSWVVWVKSC